MLKTLAGHRCMTDGEASSASDRLPFGREWYGDTRAVLLILAKLVAVHRGIFLV